MHHYLRYSVFGRLQTLALADAILRFMQQSDYFDAFFRGHKWKAPVAGRGWTIVCAVLRKSKTGECGYHSPTRHFVGGNGIDGRACDAFVAERLPDDRQIDVLAYQSEA
jgi:hypothetical protein